MRRYGIFGTATLATLLFVVAAFSQGGGQGGGQQVQTRQPTQAQQQTTPAQPPGAITGNVVSAATGEPLRKATLSLRPQGRGGSPATASTDNTGNFRFPTADPGTYTVTADRTGYVRGAYGEDRVGGQAKTFEVTTGKTTANISIKLTPHSVVTGRVYDSDGDPVQNAQVQVMRYTYPRGQRQLNNVAQATTNDLGEFRVPGLAPGRYYVSATGRGILGALQGAIADLIGGPGGPGGPGGGGRGRGAILDQILGGGESNPEDYVTTYYPRSIEASGATPLDLVAGSEMRGIDIGLLKARKFNIAGVVEGLPAPQAQPADQQAKGKGKQFGGPGGGGILNLVPRSASAQQPGVAAILNGGGVAQIAPDGTFEFRGVQPGAYYLMAQGGRGPQQGGRLSARVSVDVANSDVRNVRIRMTPPLEVTGKIAPEKADASLNLTSVRLNFTSTMPAGVGGGRGGQQGRITIAADGKFTTQLDADTYNVEIQGAPSGYYLKAVKLSGREVPDNKLDLNFNGSVLDVVLANDAGNITGTVQRTNGDPVQSARVTAVPTNGSTRTDLYKSVTSGADGTFTISTLPPGSYKLYAWEEVEQNAWMDPEFRRPFESLGTNATVKDGAGPNVTLKIIGRELVAAQ